MRIGIRGWFGAKVFRADGTLRESVATGNSLTVRGAVELIGRLTRPGFNNAAADFYGGPVSIVPFNMKGTEIVPIKELNFVSLDRADRVQYYDNLNATTLGDNRGWEDDYANAASLVWAEVSGADVGVGNDYPPLVGSGEELPSPFVKKATATVILTPGAQEYRGFYISHRATAFGSNRKVQAVLASAALAEKLVIGSGDTLHISWTLELDPTF